MTVAQRKAYDRWRMEKRREKWKIWALQLAKNPAVWTFVAGFLLGAVLM